MAAARKRCFLRFLYFTESSPPSFKIRSLQMTINLALEYVHISSRHSNLNFAQHFVIYWLFQNGANKNQHQDSYQRETVLDKFVLFFKIGKAKKVNRESKIRVCMWVRYVLKEFFNFSLVTRKCEKWVKNSIFFSSNERHFEIWFPKKRTITFFWNYLNYTEKTKFCMWQLHIP